MESNPVTAYRCSTLDMILTAEHWTKTVSKNWWEPDELWCCCSRRWRRLMSCGPRLEPSTTWFSLCWRTACFFLGVAVESNVMSRQAGDVLHQKLASIFQSLRCCQHASRSVGYLTPRFFSSNKCLWCSEVSSSKERRMRSSRWRSNVIITLEFRMKEMLQDGFLTTELIGRNFLSWLLTLAFI